MKDWTRRGLLGSLSSIPLLTLPGCTSFGPRPATSPKTGDLAPLIDAHCHLFNITDLPASSFCQTVLIKDYSPGAVLLRRALQGIERILSKGVMTAETEAALDPRMKSLPFDAAPLSDEDRRALDEQERQAEAGRRQAALVEAAIPCEPKGGFSPSIRSVRTWLQSLRSPRTAMARQLAGAHAKSGFASKLLCPALVDYSNWLGQPLKSPLPDQVRAGGRIARNEALPPVHGYVAFDPLRRALIREKKPVIDGGWDPLALVREALVDHGYLGVKLYPPMGFRPAGNAGAGEAYPSAVERTFGSRPAAGRALDLSLDELWPLCLELDAPIMAHGANSNAGGADYGRRADPAYWLPVAAKYPALRIMLGHFGRFGTYSAGHQPEPKCKDVPFEATWEAAIGRFIAQRPDSLLFADISYLSEIFHPKDRAEAVRGMKDYLRLDPGGRHLVFGSDWVMLGIEKEYPKKGGYPQRIAAFLDDCGLGPEEIGGVMYGNAMRFLGLTPGAGARKRLLNYYAKHGLPEARLPT